MDSGHAHVIEARHLGAEKFRHLGSFLRHRHIRRTAGTDHDAAYPLPVPLLHLQHPGYLVPDCLRNCLFHRLILLPAGPGAQHVDALRRQRLINLYQMGRRLSLAVHHFLEALPHLPVMIQLGEAQILIREVLQLGFGLFYRYFIIFYLS